MKSTILIAILIVGTTYAVSIAAIGCELKAIRDLVLRLERVAGVKPK